MHKILYCILFSLLIVSCKNDVKTDVNSDQASSTNNTTPISATDGQSNSTNPTATTDNAAVITNQAPSRDGNTTAVPSPSGSQQANATEADKMIFGKENKSKDYSTIEPDAPKGASGPSNLPIPDPCNLISSALLKSQFNFEGNPEIKSGSRSGANKAEKSCFFKYKDDNKPNAGILLQIMTNPYPSEIPNYPELVISGKLKDGEQTPYSSDVKKFKVWNEVGDGGCYSYSAGKYHWKIKDQYVFMLAFNTNHSESDQKRIALTIAKEVMNQFKSKVK
jgi:hypothetical protein